MAVISKKKESPLALSEDDLQSQCVQWFRWQYPDKLIWHTPNGARMKIGMAKKMKRMGVLSGVPDLFVAESNHLYHGLFIEMKRKLGVLRPEQRVMIEGLNERGYLAMACYSFEEFTMLINRYLGGKKAWRILS